MRAREWGERGAFEAHLHVLGRRACRVTAQTEVLQRMQPRRRLPEDKGDQREEGDQRSARGLQASYLGTPVIL
jgi:hypothetical protein